MLKLIASFVFVVGFGLAFAFQSPRGEKEREPLDSLAWLAGEWRGRAGNADIVSWHSDPAGGTIVMASKELENGKVNLFDFGVVSAKNGKVGYVPYPYGKPSVTFLLVDHDPKVEKAVFANDEHDFPKRFTFERKSPDSLAITLTGDQGGQPMTVDYELKLATRAAPAKK
jgi:hypothetical protein